MPVYGIWEGKLGKLITTINHRSCTIVNISYNSDRWINIHLREVICTSKDGDRFWRMPECYIRGNTIKYLRVPDERTRTSFRFWRGLRRLRSTTISDNATVIHSPVKWVRVLNASPKSIASGVG